MATVASSPGGLERRARQQDCARPARIDMPAAQADAGSRNANKAGWRGLLRAGALGQAGGSQSGGEAYRGPSLVSLELGLLARLRPLIVPWPSSTSSRLASRLLLVGHRQAFPISEVLRISPWISNIKISISYWSEMQILRPQPQTY